MAKPDSAGSLTRLAEASERLRGAATREEVLEIATDTARVLAGVEHAWAARVDDGAIGAVHTAPPATASRPEPPMAVFARLLSSGRALSRGDGVLALTLRGVGGAPEGLLAVPLAGSAPDAALDAALGTLVAATGLALESARLRARAETATHARELLFASISHDLRNPLNTFAMSTGLLRDDLERQDIDPPRALGLVARMSRATNRMQGLIEDLAEASRIDARSLDMAIDEESAAEIARTAAAPSPAGEKAAKVVCDRLEEGARVMADRARALQVLAKIVAFETKATGEGGTIHLSTARDGDAVVFSARAARADGAVAPAVDEARGGLGMLIARGLVEAQGGTFRVEAGEGLVVTFTLPAATTKA